jgi:hypothetical protein
MAAMAAGPRLALWMAAVQGAVLLLLVWEWSANPIYHVSDASLGHASPGGRAAAAAAPVAGSASTAAPAAAAAGHAPHEGAAVIFAYFERPGYRDTGLGRSCARHLQFFIEVGVVPYLRPTFAHVHTVVVLNGNFTTVPLPAHPNLLVLGRENVGEDFAAYGAGLRLLQARGLFASKRSFTFLNCGAFGPVMAATWSFRAHWTFALAQWLTRDIRVVGPAVGHLREGHTTAKERGPYYVVRPHAHTAAPPRRRADAPPRRAITRPTRACARSVPFASSRSHFALALSLPPHGCWLMKPCRRFPDGRSPRTQKLR